MRKIKSIISLVLALILACAAALVIVSLATYKRSPTPFLNPHAEAVK